MCRKAIIQSPTYTVQKCSIGNESSWSAALAEYIRHNDQTLQEQAKKLLSTVATEMMPCESFAEFIDVAGKFPTRAMCSTSHQILHTRLCS